MKQKLTKEEVLHIAKLANLHLTEAEIVKFQKQLSEVLSYMEILKKVNTAKTNPTTQVTGLTNITRDDEVKASLEVKTALSGSKEKHDNYFKVKAIFED
jgi:aspartyl-tRNA(Asn)/glutamyl-tRNA(Gln) amidotransferase subunit C